MKEKIKSLPGEGSQTCSHIEPSTEQNLLRAVSRRHSSQWMALVKGRN